MEQPTGSGEPAREPTAPHHEPTAPHHEPTAPHHEPTAPPGGPTARPRADTSSFEAGPRDGGKDRGRLAFLRELPVLILVAFGLAILLKTFVIQAFYIPSGSMEPTLAPGDRVLVMKAFDTPQRGDIIVFENPRPTEEPGRGIVGGFLHWLSEGLGFARPVDEDFIKRVIGLPGETVELRNGKLLVDGVQILEPYLEGPPDTRDYGPVKVPKNKLFVLGDNRLNSNDSRYGLGFVPRDRVVGEAFIVIWPPSRISWLH